MLQTEGAPLCDADRRILRRQLDTLANRGPDASGEFIRGSVGFGHRRLAIRDVSQGQQPWVSTDGQCALVYNGELYNDAALRGELADSFSFRTKCDTEVVMAAYLKWGRKCVERFQGMFALAIYDFRDSELWLVRDRFGVKPVYYAMLDRHFVFASHPAAILLHPDYSKQPDWAVVSHYLSTTRLTLGSRSLYQGIHLLQPAEEMVVRGNKTETGRYWHYPTTRSSMSYDDAVDFVEDELTASVSRRLVSDVPVGLFLSGGVDSCTIASLLNKIDSRPRYAACASASPGHLDNSVDQEELASATECAKLFSTQLESVRVSEHQYMERWQELLQAFRLPLSTPSDVMIYELAKSAKARVGVVLGGEGADELLCGYEIASWSGYDYDATHSGLENNALLQASISRQYGRCEFLNEADHYFALNSLVPSWAKANMLRPSVFDSIDYDSAMFAQYQSVFDSCKGLSTVEKYAIVLHRINLESLLARLDSTTMHAGLEARVPFTDHKLVEKVLQLPLHYRMDVTHGEESRNLASAELAATGRIRSKRVLRDVARRFLPERLANRRKASFPTGVRRWLENDWQRTMSDYLVQSPFAQFLFTNSFVRELKESPDRAGMMLWPIANLAFWGDAEFFDSPYIPQSRTHAGRTLVV